MATESSVAVAGLRHVDDVRMPGLRREATGRTTRSGKRHIPLFVIRDAHGKRVRDPATLERVRKLAIPPAWTDVWICPVDSGHIQATGRDARGRKQYRYHARWRAERDRTKFERMECFGRVLPKLRRRVEADLRLKGLPRRKVLATVVRLLETTLIRVGNEEYARANRSYGLTTLENRHVEVSPREIRFHFRGKSGVEHQVAVGDPRLARIVRACRDLPGHELFEYVADDGTIQKIDSADVNAYIHEIAGQEFTAKDFRTWAGTVLASVALQELAGNGGATGRHSPRPSRHPRTASSSLGGTTSRRNRATPLRRAARVAVGRAKRLANGLANGRKERGVPPTQREVVQAVKEVACRLGNTPAVCRKSYIHPAVISAYLGGTLGEQVGIERKPDSKAAATDAKTDRLTALGRALTAAQRPKRGRSNIPRGLRPEEEMVLVLLASTPSA